MNEGMMVMVTLRSLASNTAFISLSCHQTNQHTNHINQWCMCTTYGPGLHIICNDHENKKSELMLMRHARAYGSSCSQLILVYLYPVRRTSLFCSQKSQNVTKILYFQRHARSSMLIPLTSTSPLLVMII